MRVNNNIELTEKERSVLITYGDLQDILMELFRENASQTLAVLDGMQDSNEKIFNQILNKLKELNYEQGKLAAFVFNVMSVKMNMSVEKVVDVYNDFSKHYDEKHKRDGAE